MLISDIYSNSGHLCIKLVFEIGLELYKAQFQVSEYYQIKSSSFVE